MTHRHMRISTAVLVHGRPKLAILANTPMRLRRELASKRTHRRMIRTILLLSIRTLKYYRHASTTAVRVYLFKV